MPNPTQLQKTLSLSQAVGLAITIVVGSGLLLPGLAYQSAGASSIYVWLINAGLIIPLLVIFSSLGVRYPTAGGVAGYMQGGFSRPVAAGTEVILMGTFGLGIPAIALTGGYYASILFPPHWRGDGLILGLSLGLVLLGWAINYLGASISGRVQKFLALFLVGMLVLIPLAALGFSTAAAGVGIASPQSAEMRLVLPLIGMVFFAFTGWEMLSFTIEEYKNPKRDYPISVAITFVLVTALYLLLVVALQLLIAADDPRLAIAPLAALAQHVWGDYAAALVALLSVLIILANVVGATWAASRLVFSSAREKLLPPTFAALSRRAVPTVALGGTCGVFVLVLLVQYTGWLSVSDLLRLAGQNFCLLYGMAILAYLRISRGRLKIAFGLFALGVVALAAGSFGAELVYPLGLFLLGYAINKWRTGRGFGG